MGRERHSPGDCHHFLLAAAQVQPLSVHELSDLGKHREDPRLGVARCCHAFGLCREPAADHEVLGYGELRKDAGVLRCVADAALGPPMRWQRRDLLAAKPDAAGMDGKQPGDALDDGRTSGAVAPDEGYDLVTIHAYPHTAHDMSGSSVSVDIGNFEQHRSPSLTPPMIHQPPCSQLPLSPASLPPC